MAQRNLGSTACVVAGLLVLSLGAGASAGAEELGERAMQEIRSFMAEKASRTPAQRKLATALLYASRQSRGLAMVQGLPQLPRIANRAGVQPDGTVVVDIHGEVTDALLRTIADMGGRVSLALPKFGAVRARVPVRRLEALAGLPEVRFITPRQGYLVNAVTSEGDVAHAADSARTTYGIDGTGVKVGILSDGVDSLAAQQLAGELPGNCGSPPTGACVAVVPGQEGSGDEGTAMMEIVHDLAPGAQLYFATAIDSSAAFAANILTLKNTYGCDVLVDDVTYFDEGAFQDGDIAKAVNSVKAGGALFFSAVGNSGRKDAVPSTSGTWEGDYKNSGTSIDWFETTPPYYWAGKQIHSWNGATGASAVNANALTADAPYAISLKWSDPLGAAVTDYDLFLFNSDMSIVWDASTDDQESGASPDPFEIMGAGFTGEKIVVVRWSGATKALRLDTNRGRLTIGTARAAFGHNAAESAVSVAATNAAGMVSPFTGGSANPVETYSSDGPRRIFYSPNGTAITTGNVLFATGGGRELQKPDLTAADCVKTGFAAGGDFNPFCGTSAAAPHAAAIAALLKSLAAHPTGDQALAAMISTALDVNPAGRDSDAGAGIVMADRAADLIVNPPPGASFNTVFPCRVFDTRLVGSQTSGSPLACGAVYDFTMVDSLSPLVNCGVPSGAKAVSINMTVTATSVLGFVKAFASGTPPPVPSIVNYNAKDTRANNAVVSLSSAGQMGVQCSSGTTHVIVDVNGYFQ
jgi:hypothetical protein